MTEQQISMFAMLDAYETPEIPPDEQKKGGKGWIIECSGIFLKKNGFDHDHRGVCTRQVILEKDTRPDPKAWDGWFQAGHTIKGPYHGWYGPVHRIFRQRPTWSDCLKYMADTRLEGEPEEVGYYEVIGDWNGAKYEY
jgi:hypothetical protein